MEIINNMEIFKDIIKFENTYQISNYGRVLNKKTGLFLQFFYNKKGYQYVYLSYSYTGRVKWYIHRLVAYHFIDNPYNKPQVNHIDGNKQNNNIDNLEWCTNEENQRHAVLNHLHCQGESHKDSKFTKETILLLPELIKLGFRLKEISELTGVSHQNIRKILDGKSWKQLNLFTEKVIFKSGPRLESDKIYMTKDFYFKCVMAWGNTVLNKMIAKGILLV